VSAVADLSPGDIVQIGPSHPWACCLAVVDEVRPWGVMAYVHIPKEEGQAYTRLAWADFEVVGGRAVWETRRTRITPRGQGKA
jgi:hypothetical protein